MNQDPFLKSGNPIKMKEIMGSDLFVDNVLKAIISSGKW